MMLKRLSALFLVLFLTDSYGFRCKNGFFVPESYICNGQNDCRDYSDEENCGSSSSAIAETCKPEEWQCDDKQCIPIDKFCNGEKNCNDDSDEYEDCYKNKTCNAFRCNNGYCIDENWLCDGMNDCKDYSDEMNCENKFVEPQDCNNTIGKYLCTNKRCISLSLVCNSKNDCGDGSDENTSECEKAQAICSNIADTCSQKCTATPLGPQCSCLKGFELTKDTCKDRDECMEYGICAQHCYNTIGSYYCSCEFGYVLQQDGKNCKAAEITNDEASMIYVSKTSISGYYLESKSKFLIIDNLQHVVGVSVDNSNIYWSDIQLGEETINKILINGTKQEIIVTSGLGCPEDIAIDWVTKNIYFTDSGFKQIGVCNSDGELCTVIMKEATEKPRGIALFPSEGKMYWSDWGEHPHISVAYMDGKYREYFIDNNIFWPNGLTIDDPNKRLYWADAKLKVIESIQLDGQDRRTIFHDVVKHPYSIAVFENLLYWSDWSTNSIHSCNKFTGKDFNTLFKNNETIYGIHIHHSILRTKLENPCITEPCSHLCLLAANRTYSCACTLDKELKEDKHTCEEAVNRKYIAIAAGNTIIEYYHELLGKPKINTIVTSNHIDGMTYDSISGSIIAIDETNQLVLCFNFHSNNINCIVPILNEIVTCIAFDYFGNNLYKSITIQKKIEIYSLTTKEKTEFTYTENPHDLIVVPEEGFMFIVFGTDNHYHIDKAQMNGLGPITHLIEHDLIGPKISLAYDLDKKRLFWADEGSGRIESIDILGQNRNVFRTGITSPANIAILNEEIFWTTRKSTRLNWANKKQNVPGNKSVNLNVTNNFEILYLQTIDGIHTDESHPCRKNNGNCSHVCLVTNSNQRLCTCPSGFVINTDNQSCKQITLCLDDEIICTKNDKCIKKVQKCNGNNDCPDGEDEKDCLLGSSKCQPNKFACHDGECIDTANRCNSIFDCKDHSDEQNCENYSCSDEEYRCGNGKCISKYFVCNGMNDCKDFSDEENCSACNGTHFKCNSGSCIPQAWECDGQIDCSDGSDEHESCKPTIYSENRFSCKNEEYRCGDGKCLSKYLICNGINDCDDFSDEENCNACNGTHFKCNSGFCIPRSWECDGQIDCNDASDEHESCKPAECSKNMFSCKNGQCIDILLKCDGANDCEDNSDEDHCLESPKLDALICPKDYYKCKNSTLCIHEKLRCNGYVDCPMKDDENNCERCLSGAQFTCRNNRCIPLEFVCDQINNCGDDSDELNCDSTIMHKPEPHWKSSLQLNCSLNQFACKADFCLPLSMACDGIDQCLDGSDEGGECEKACEINSCEHVCHKTPKGPVCSCRDGYQLEADGKSCIDVDECQHNICSQNCTNHIGSYSCSCFNGFALRLNQISCKSTGPVVKIITATEDEIRISSSLASFNPLKVLYREPGVKISGLDVNSRKNTIYWSNEILGIINKMNINTKQRTTATDEIGKPEILVVDWITDNVYFYDSKEIPSIKICDIDANICTKIVNIDEPKSRVSAIAIEPHEEFLFWSQVLWEIFEAPASIILRTNLMGTDKKIIVNDNLGIVSGVTIDHHRSLLYWADNSEANIQCIDFNGNHRRIIMSDLFVKPIGLYFYEDSLYWKAEANDGILRKRQLYGDSTYSSYSMIQIGNNNLNKIFVMSQISRQPKGENKCKNRGCHHLCIMHKGEPTCLYPNDSFATIKNSTILQDESLPVDEIIEKFRCRDGRYIPKNLICNGINDCNDFSDEENCGGDTCGDNYFQCTSKFCIPRVWECDGQVDCNDGSDEHKLCKLTNCDQSMFSCKNGRCIDVMLRCNGVSDCEDESDEVDCPENPKIELLVCTKDEYRCSNSTICIHKNLRCNGNADCPMGDDERDCSRCLSATQFTCHNGTCIPLEWLCDQKNDCGDGSDELNCDSIIYSNKVHLSSSNSIQNCSKNQFHCGGGSCLPFNMVCDGIKHCLDGSDEGGHCERACELNMCQSICHKTPKGPVCSCSKGYKLDANEKSCSDIDECQKNICSQICTNRLGSFSCSCFKGFVLKPDGVSCKAIGPAAKIISANIDQIRLLSPPSSFKSSKVLHQDIGIEITGLDVNTRENTIYWSNGAIGVIHKMNIDTKQLITASNEVYRPEILAVDWITDNIYVFDNKQMMTIKVCNIDADLCSKIVHINESNKVSAIVVEPHKEVLFWSQVIWKVYEEPTSEILRTDLMGTNQKVVVRENLSIVTGLTIDHHRSILYWTDKYQENIECIDFNGYHRKVIVSDLTAKPIGLYFYEDSLYWKMEPNGELIIRQLYGNRTDNLIRIEKNNLGRLFVVSQISGQPEGPNKCKNRGCDHICVIVKGLATCICKNGYLATLNNGTICVSNNNEFKIMQNSKSDIHEAKMVKETETLSSHRKKVLNIIIILAVILISFILVVIAYFCFKKKRTDASRSPGLSINFQNPSFTQDNNNPGNK